MDYDDCPNKGCSNMKYKEAPQCESCRIRAFCAVKADLETVVGKPRIDVAEGMGPVEIAAYKRATDVPLHEKYPKYHKAIPKGLQSIDVYAVCSLFPVDDPSGCINHARKKLLVPGVRTGGKSMYKDVMEARDTLNRWLELNVPSTDVA